jgi:D-aminoacyl-tRNA deacylase
MIAVVQRVSEARVLVDNQLVGEISTGLLVLAAIHRDDRLADLSWMAKKLLALRIFPNADKHFDLDVQQVSGGLLLISNFTVASETTKGRRPSLDAAASPDQANKLFEEFVTLIRASTTIKVQTGRFGASMQVTLTNSGPATFILNSVEARQERPPR